MNHYLVLTYVLLVTVLSTAGLALPYPILAPLFMSGELNGLNDFMSISPALLLGIALAVYPLGIFIGGAVIGALSDSYGRKKCLVITLFLSVCGYMSSAYAIVNEAYLLFLMARFITGLCEGNVSISRAIALDLGDRLDKTRAMSLIGGAFFLGWLIGPLAGGYLAEYGPEVAFQVAGVAISFCMFFVILVIPETHKVKTNKSFYRLVRSHNSLTLLRYPRIYQLFILQLIFCLGLNAFYEFFPVWLTIEKGYLPYMIGDTMAIMGLSMMLTSVCVVTLLKGWLGMEVSLVSSILMTALFMLVIPFLSDVSMIAAFALTGASIAIYNGLLPAYASDTNQDVGSGALMGLLTATFFLANSVIAILGSIILILSPAFPLFLGSCLILISTLLMMKFIYTHDT
ncbi:MFS transporter [Shewanella surugensis]|uniref:MFS transporter n=1 Tax=Shewanella surugensis TaxID=212020 RepID=A0ABT0LHQ7_9GAMM|nr:MFS transporter [Shewanella surugensis]MCL1127237.1 MFS transporter [Shewanella surugensis]